MAKSSRSSEKSHHHPMLRYLAIGLLSLGLFFSLLFYVYDSRGNGVTGTFHDTHLYQYILILTALSVGGVILCIYKHSNPLSKMLENGVLIAAAVIAALAIGELNHGSVENFGTSSPDTATLNIYATLFVGFAGSGALMACLHNLYNRRTTSISF